MAIVSWYNCRMKNNKHKIQTIIALFVMPFAITNPAQASPVVEPTSSVVVKPDTTLNFVKNLKPVKVVYTKKTMLKPHELKNILHEVGFRGNGLKTAWATAMKESTGRPMAHNKNSKTGDNSYGLFQINMIGSLGPARLKQFNLSRNEDLFDPYTNAKIAFKMSNGGKNWSAWNGITDRTREYLAQFPG
jgi:hypothetical protein